MWRRRLSSAELNDDRTLLLERNHQSAANREQHGGARFHRCVGVLSGTLFSGIRRAFFTGGDCGPLTTPGATMRGRNVLMYFPWSRPDEEGAYLGNLDNRFGALFELRRLQWPKFEALADIVRFDQGIAGFLDNVFLQNYSLFREDMRIRMGNAVRIVERHASDGKSTLLDGDLLDNVDILIIVSFDSQRTGQNPNDSELAAVRKFLDDPGHTLFVCPHHDIGNVDGVPAGDLLKSQEVEFRHHGDLGIPGQQRLGGFARSLLRDLRVPVCNRFGLRPARLHDGSATPIKINSKADRFNLLQGVGTFNLHPHLPHFEMLGESPHKMDVLVEQSIDLEAPPHPFVKQGRKTFDALLQSKPNVFGGRLLICDATIWTSTNGGLGSLRQLWANITRLA
jgi:hypothetical protein